MTVAQARAQSRSIIGVPSQLFLKLQNDSFEGMNNYFKVIYTAWCSTDRHLILYNTYQPISSVNLRWTRVQC